MKTKSLKNNVGKIYPNISVGVSKLGNTIPSVSLPAGITCRADAPCAKGCYACKGRLNCKTVKDSYSRNLETYKANPKGYFDVINFTLEQIPYKFFRYHVAGDIPDMQYLDLMCKTARKNKGTKFLCFTKKFELVNEYLKNHSKPKNLIIVLSNWGYWMCENPHNLPMSYVRFKNEDTPIPDTAKPCNGNCGECSNTKGSCWNLKNGESVVFKKH